MKEALIIFIILLLLLTIISVFGGSIRYTPPSNAAPQPLRMQQMQMPYHPYEGFYSNNKPKTAPAPGGGAKSSTFAPPVDVVPPVASASPAAPVEAFQGAGEFAPF